MDATISYPLVVLPEHGFLVPVSAERVLDDHHPDPSTAQPDYRAFSAFLWQRFARLSLLFLIALSLGRSLLRHIRALQQQIRDLQQQLIDLRQQANFWRAMHQRALERETAKTNQIHLLEGEIRELKHRIFGRKTETTHATQPKTKQSPANPNQNATPRPRGQQPGSPGHGRRDHVHLNTLHENCTLPPDQQRCPCCGEPFEEIPGATDGEILEIDVKAHRRVYHRQRYRRRCTCPGQPAVVTAPPPDKLIPKSNIGISIWVLILQHKFEFYQPLYRVLAELRSHDLNLAAGSITGGLQKLVPLFEPLYQSVIEYNRQAGHWHCDETRWRVFVKQADKAGFVWYLWVFAAADSIVFVLDPTRAHDVPETHFGEDGKGIINVDRYSAYKAMPQVKAGQMILAFCWAHVRRDFLAVLTGWSELTDWAWSWLEDISTLYHRNDQRLALKDGALNLEDGTMKLEDGTWRLEDSTLKQANLNLAWQEADLSLREHVEHMQKRCEQELADPKLRLPQRKVLTSLQEHWSGLTVFVEHPEVPLDNNEAERRERGPVVARKNYYGSGALWSGRLAAMMFSLMQTVQVWGMDVRKWLTAYLTACAEAKGKPPPDPERWLPWKMTAEERERMSVTKPAKAKEEALPPPPE
jgi:transposase